MAKSKSYMQAYRAVNGGGSVATMLPTDMTNGQLSDAIRQTRGKLDDAAARLDELAHRIEDANRSPREGREARMDTARREYNEGSELYNQLRDRLFALEDEQSRRRRASEPTTHRTFVNSYGEATRRNITSQGYESAQRRLDRRMESWMRGR